MLAGDYRRGRRAGVHCSTVKKLPAVLHIKMLAPKETLGIHAIYEPHVAICMLSLYNALARVARTSLTQFHLYTDYNKLNGGPVLVDGQLTCIIDNDKCCWTNAPVG